MMCHFDIVAGEPFWSIVADLTDHKLVFGLCMVMQILTMEILRVSRPLTYNLIFFVKVLRTTTAPSSTLTTTASFKLTEGTNEGTFCSFLREDMHVAMNIIRIKLCGNGLMLPYILKIEDDFHKVQRHLIHSSVI